MGVEWPHGRSVVTFLSNPSKHELHKERPMPPNPEPRFSVVSTGALAEPANTFIRKVSDLVEGAFAPYQIRRVAKAKADAAITQAESEIEMTDLHKRAARRWIEEEARRQKNMEDIADKALPLLEKTADPAAVDDDWIVHFFDKCRRVNSEQMQGLWSRALAGEANIPGSFSKRTVTALAGLDAAEAKWFTALCGYVYVIGSDMVPLVFDVDDDIYSSRGVTFSTMGDLESIGLVRLSGFTQFSAKRLPREETVYYYDRALRLRLPNDSDNYLHVGSVLLTRIGRELAPICGSEPVKGFWEYVAKQWQEYVRRG